MSPTVPFTARAEERERNRMWRLDNRGGFQQPLAIVHL